MKGGLVYERRRRRRRRRNRVECVHKYKYKVRCLLHVASYVHYRTVHAAFVCWVLHLSRRRRRRRWVSDWVRKCDELFTLLPSLPRLPPVKQMMGNWPTTTTTRTKCVDAVYFFLWGCWERSASRRVTGQSCIDFSCSPKLRRRSRWWEMEIKGVKTSVRPPIRPNNSSSSNMPLLCPYKCKLNDRVDDDFEVRLLHSTNGTTTTTTTKKKRQVDDGMIKY